jgi:hypothetical protein
LPALAGDFTLLILIHCGESAFGASSSLGCHYIDSVLLAVMIKKNVIGSSWFQLERDSLPGSCNSVSHCFVGAFAIVRATFPSFRAVLIFGKLFLKSSLLMILADRKDGEGVDEQQLFKNYPGQSCI